MVCVYVSEAAPTSEAGQLGEATVVKSGSDVKLTGITSQKTEVSSFFLCFPLADGVYSYCDVCLFLKGIFKYVVQRVLYCIKCRAC